MTDFLRFVAGVALSATILASAFAFILKSVATWGSPKQGTITSAKKQPSKRAAKMMMKKMKRARGHSAKSVGRPSDEVAALS